MPPAIRRVASDKTVDAFRDHLAAVGASLPVDDAVEVGPDAPLARPVDVDGLGAIGNRFAILPMEGWDGTEGGRPTDLTRRRWRNFGRSGAKLVWGGEAVAVRPDGRANPRQLVIDPANLGDLATLREDLEAAHVEATGSAIGLAVGLQLTHSGRYARPTSAGFAPMVAYRHPILDERSGVASDDRVMTDAMLDDLVGDFIEAARLAREAGFGFVDVKHCHGYLGHELLSAVDRPGRYGGSLANRGRFLAEVAAGIRAEAPGLAVGVRLSLFDLAPFRPGLDGAGEPATSGPGPYRWAFGGDGTGVGIDIAEVSGLLTLFERAGVRMICATAGSPYYNPHVVRPAAFPPSDGYLPPEDPLVGVARQVDAAARLKALHPGLLFVGSGYSYLQDWLPNVAQAAVRRGLVDVVGLGRMVLSYPELPIDVLNGRPMARKKVCRTFSDCTTAPRNGMVSGCYPLDPAYKATPERDRVSAIKQAVADKLAAR